MGVDLKALIDAGALELHYSELGVGGAGRETGVPALTVVEVATFPFAGVDGIYSAARDPWLVPMLKSYAVEFYAKLAAWLANPFNKTHRCARASPGRGWGSGQQHSSGEPSACCSGGRARAVGPFKQLFAPSRLMWRRPCPSLAALPRRTSGATARLTSWAW